MPRSHIEIEFEDSLELHEVARLPDKRDNVAIAVKTLPAAIKIKLPTGHVVTLDYTVLEGHRFSVRDIDSGSDLLSWNLPFGKAARNISKGCYVCNQGVLDSLRPRNFSFPLPPAPNFNDFIPEYVLEDSFRPCGASLAPRPPLTFQGIRRPRGVVGTRNYIAILPLSSLAGSLSSIIAKALSDVPGRFPNIDGVVELRHTEGGASPGHNTEKLLSVLSGWYMHANVGGVVVLDHPKAPIHVNHLHEYLDRRYPCWAQQRAAAHSVSGDIRCDVEACKAAVSAWLADVHAEGKRVPCSFSHLSVALQCGGSDAFSGISGNPLAGQAAKEIIRMGGKAVLAETDELMGAEPYILANVRSTETAQKFLEKIANFKALTGAHGHSAEGNPSGGNKLRGLYNIVLKSIGAAMKKQPEVSLDSVLDYGQPACIPGFHFMDSPGNDLESIAGQVASGCNIIFFITGNGSITNFPFVPTLKIVTTTERFNLLRHDMDVNAGRYLDGVPMDTLVEEVLSSTAEIASGTWSVGEAARHYQVSIWRDWAQGQEGAPGALDPLEQLQAGAPLALPPHSHSICGSPPLDLAQFPLKMIWQDSRALPCSTVIGLVLPTSLCSSQIAEKIAGLLNDKYDDASMADTVEVHRFVALPHTEGCGSAGNETLYVRVMLSHLLHPSVGPALLLEHGCEKTHNKYMEEKLRETTVGAEAAASLGWASVQLDGGIDKCIQKCVDYFAAAQDRWPRTPRADVPWSAIQLGFLVPEPLSPEALEEFCNFITAVASAGAAVVLPHYRGIPHHTSLLQRLLGQSLCPVTLSHAQPVPPRPTGPQRGNIHVMHMPTHQWTECMVGMAAAGVHALVSYATDIPCAPHPFVPLIQATHAGGQSPYFDLCLPGSVAACTGANLARAVATVLSGTAEPRTRSVHGLADFQVTRGLCGVSM
mmetsp:Transcript_20989/g.53139  ORF Transcript_20989/g.53139 Transcript_20989/m.53139 type:complete len:931 (+) Transcript_20989:159-2951(+)